MGMRYRLVQETNQPTMNTKMQILVDGLVLESFIDKFASLNREHTVRISDGEMAIIDHKDSIRIEHQDGYFECTYSGVSFRQLLKILNLIEQQPVCIEFNNRIEIKSLLL